MSLKHAFILLLVCMPVANAADKSVGIGLGSLYSGLGFNVGIRTSHTFKYISAGCSAYGFSSGSSYSDPNGEYTKLDSTQTITCGSGVGFMQSGLFSLSKRHALGFHVGVNQVQSDYPEQDGDVRYTVQATYNFFTGGQVGKGFNLGFAPMLRIEEGGVYSGLNFTIGYQF